jgi:hypothetical protein
VRPCSELDLGIVCSSLLCYGGPAALSCAALGLVVFFCCLLRVNRESFHRAKLAMNVRRGDRSSKLSGYGSAETSFVLHLVGDSTERVLVLGSFCGYYI